MHAESPSNCDDNLLAAFVKTEPTERRFEEPYNSLRASFSKFASFRLVVK